jgi:hydroxymethylglutaryl-CoA lyase
MASKRITLVEVGPRDGIQAEPKILSTAEKVDFITRVMDAGIKRIEVASFVNPKRVPQMADAEEVMAALPRGAASYIGLVLNRRGIDRAIAAGVSEINFAVVATDTFSRRNQGAGTAEIIAAWAEVAKAARAAKIPSSVTISAAFGCPFEGEVPIERVLEVVKQVAENPPDELALADTIGVATPRDVKERVGAVAQALPGMKLRCHFHNTRSTGLANSYAAVESGIAVLDSSIGGVGGCPFAPAATGNTPTEDLVYMLERMGIATGLSLAKLIETAIWLEAQLMHPVPGMLSRAGTFPRASARP